MGSMGQGFDSLSAAADSSVGRAMDMQCGLEIHNKEVHRFSNGDTFLKAGLIYWRPRKRVGSHSGKCLQADGP